MKMNQRFLFGLLSLLLAAVIAFVALPTIARQTNGKTEIVRITKPILKGEKITADNTEVVEVAKLFRSTYYNEHDFPDCHKVEQLKMFKNGRVDIRFSSEASAREFVDEYLGTVC